MKETKRHHAINTDADTTKVYEIFRLAKGRADTIIKEVADQFDGSPYEEVFPKCMMYIYDNYKGVDRSYAIVCASFCFQRLDILEKIHNVIPPMAEMVNDIINNQDVKWCWSHRNPHHSYRHQT